MTDDAVDETDLALVALIGVISLLAGLDAIHASLPGRGGLTGTVGLLLTTVALVLLRVYPWAGQAAQLDAVRRIRLGVGMRPQ